MLEAIAFCTILSSSVFFEAMNQRKIGLFGQLNVIKRGAFRQEITPKPSLALDMWLSHENLSGL